MRRAAIVTVLAVLVVVAGFGAASLLRGPRTMLADSRASCANQKLPSYFVADPDVVRRAGGKPVLYVEGATEDFSFSPTARPVHAPGPKAAPHVARDATLPIVSVGRPDAGTLLLAVASDEPDRERGLMCVTSMAPRVGMIFVFPNEAVENFWMKDTLIPLDMVFVAGSGKVTAVAANVPSSRIDQAEPTLARRAGEGRFVIELNAGEAARDHITVGSKLDIPKLISRN